MLPRAATTCLIAFCLAGASATAADRPRMGWWDDAVEDVVDYVEDTIDDAADVVDAVGGDDLAGGMRDAADDAGHGLRDALDDEEEHAPDWNAPAMTLRCDASCLLPGEASELLLDMAAGTGVYDGYLALVMPDGSLLTFAADSETPFLDVQPFAVGWTATDLPELPVKTLHLPDGTPPGEYLWCMALTRTGASPLEPGAVLSMATAAFTVEETK